MTRNNKEQPNEQSLDIDTHSDKKERVAVDSIETCSLYSIIYTADDYLKKIINTLEKIKFSYEDTERCLKEVSTVEEMQQINVDLEVTVSKEINNLTLYTNKFLEVCDDGYSEVVDDVVRSLRHNELN